MRSTSWSAATVGSVAGWSVLGAPMTMAATQLAVVIPVLNGGEIWERCAEAIAAQMPSPGRVLVIDSGSSDGSDRVAEAAGFDLVRIDNREFDHGGTRQMAIDRLPDAEVVSFLTQDAVLATVGDLQRLCAAFGDPTVGCAYGRQLPRISADPVESHARLFNYPDQPARRSRADIATLGMKAAFLSNSFAAYRREALLAVGGFPRRLILGEDTVAAARMLQKGWAISYVAGACVYHSHPYTLMEEFRRYFDIGSLHQEQAWLLEELGSPEGEGARFVRSELTYLFRVEPRLVPPAILRTIAKYAAYQAGRHALAFPDGLRRKLSMHRQYWDRKVEEH